MVEKTIKRAINPNRISTARKRRGMTKTELATRIGVDLRTVSNYESGQSIPTPETLARLPSALGFPLDFFYGEDLEPIENVSFRSLARMTAKQRDMALSQGSLALWLSSWLEKRFEMPSSNLPDLRLEANDTEAAAASLRRMWNLGEMSIRNMVHLLESNGVRVFRFQLTRRKLTRFRFGLGTTLSFCSIPLNRRNGVDSTRRTNWHI